MENFKQRMIKLLNIIGTVGAITINNIEDIYKQNYKKYLHYNSDEVNGIKDGFPLTELDFILQELKVIENSIGEESFTDKKRIEIYLKKLQSRKIELSNIESLPPQQTETENVIKHPFSDPDNFELFKYFLENWKQPKTDKSKFTYFFDYLTRIKKEVFSQRQFFTFIASYCSISISKNRQSNAINGGKDEYLKQLEQQFDKQKP